MDFMFIGCSLLLLLTLIGILLYYVTSDPSFEQALEDEKNKKEFDLLTSSTNAGGAKNEKKEKSKKSNYKKIARLNRTFTNKITKSSKIQRTTKTTIPALGNENNAEKVELPSNACKEPESNQEKPEEENTEVMTQTMTDSSTVNEMTNSTEVSPPVSESASQSVAKSNQNLVSKTNNDLKINKKNKKSINSKVPQEFDMNTIIEALKLSSKEEITFLTDYLLNMQADQINDLNWHKKNDPIESLKKQLSEKEEIISTQKNNLESAKRKLQSLQDELTLNKKQLNNESKIRKDLENEKNKCLNIINELEQNQLKNKQKMEKLEEHVGLLRQEELNKLGIIQEYKTKVANQQSIISKLEDMNNKTIAQMKEDFEKEKNQIEESLKKKSDQHRVYVEKMNAENSTVNSKNDELRKEIEKMTNEIEELKRTLAENEKTLSEKIKVNQKEKDDLQIKIVDLTNANNLLSIESEKVNKGAEKKDEFLNIICGKLDISKNDGDPMIIKRIEELKAAFSEYETLKENYKKIVLENETLEKKMNEIEEKNKQYITTLQETDGTLKTIQDKIVTEGKYYRSELFKKDNEIMSMKKELHSRQERIDLLINDQTKLSEDLKKINEFYKTKEDEFADLQKQNELLIEKIEQERMENRNLKIKNDKLNEVVQIGMNTYQEENKKVQDLESKLATLNGNENNCQMPTTNGN